ncbi:protocatechuate 3,4-dioxygenase [Pararhodobacter zhoushanensis]|uniref:Protocatechuate 3,4-dioxygenase n=1 Tax=Pararhodobacter zhoushanensis TaxID=2479545 RepID=A0ABT3GXL7_9RHOB|nr:protocatechuate 3,4-dioxygenase [Pararhodobacter zhoushanensis]MCW1932294.1 protocatechuate 3,4-dioxygenase [Pararhodobacter zhoushanensis]
MSNSIPLTLDEPGTYVFTAEAALRGHKLTAFGLSLRRPDNRKIFLADEEAYMQKAGLTDAQIALVRARDWTGLIRAGGHLQSMLKVAATVGQDLWHIGAHNAGISREELIALCPRRLDITPEGGI